MRKVLKLIDSINEWVGVQTRWFSVALMLIGVIGVFRRYALHQSTVWEYELIMWWVRPCMPSWGYIMLHQAHTRVDVFYSRLSPRGKPSSMPYARSFILSAHRPTSQSFLFVDALSFSINEKSSATYVYPPLYPLRTIVFLGFLLFFLQGLATFIRDVYFAVKGEPL